MVTVPLVLLAIPSVYAGWAYVEPMLIGDYFGGSIVVRPEHPAMWAFKAEWHGVAGIHPARRAEPAVLAGARRDRLGLVLYLVNPGAAGPDREGAADRSTRCSMNHYYFDRFNDWFFAGGARVLGGFLSRVGDRSIIDGFFVNGAARVVGWTAALVRNVQSGYVYHYAFTMILGVFALLTWWTR